MRQVGQVLVPPEPSQEDASSTESDGPSVPGKLMPESDAIADAGTQTLSPLGSDSLRHLIEWQRVQGNSLPLPYITLAYDISANHCIKL